MASDTTSEPSTVYHSVARGAHRRDPNLITCKNSDGDSSKWRETGPTLDSTGATCYWKADDPVCQSLSEKWKKTLGKTAAKLLGLSEDGSDEEWKVVDFPKDYKLYRHIKGNREDFYLLGSKYVTKFRTANEFSPHFHWLCTYEPTPANRVHCKCKYCSGSKTQGLVNSSLGINDKTKRFSSPILDQKSASLNKRKAEEEMAKESMRKRTTSESIPGIRAPRVSQRPTPARKPLPVHLLNSVASGGVPGRKQTFSGPYVNKDRDRDLSELRCTFRMAELVWCKLDQPIQGATEGRPDLSIDYWPGICEERVLISSPEVCTENDTPEGKPDQSNGTKSPAQSSTLSLSIHQKYQWKVRLLATSDVYYKDESELLPYLNYPPPLNIYKLPIDPQSLKHIHDGHESDRPTIASITTFSDAVTPFALSLQITAHIKKSFTLMDRYDIAILKRLEARGQNLPLEDVQILYEDSTLPWYQYLWWGAEKIWSGELIRMIVSAPDLPQGLRPTSSNSHACCFFLKITGIYRSHEEQGMVKGPIFELAPLAQREIDEADKNPEFLESDNVPGVQQINRYMPRPPDGYFFRRLTPVGKEHHLVLQHIAGRYYPPHDRAIVRPFVKNESEPPAPLSIEGRSLILAGMAEGRWLHMHCEIWTLDRKECFKEAEASAERELITFCSKIFGEKIKTKSVAVVEPPVAVLQSATGPGTDEVTDSFTPTVSQNPDLIVEVTQQVSEPQSVPSAGDRIQNPDSMVEIPQLPSVPVNMSLAGDQNQSPDVIMHLAPSNDESSTVPSAGESRQNSELIAEATKEPDEARSFLSRDAEPPTLDLVQEIAKQGSEPQGVSSVGNQTLFTEAGIVEMKMPSSLLENVDVEMNSAPFADAMVQDNVLVSELVDTPKESTQVTDTLPIMATPSAHSNVATHASRIDAPVPMQSLPDSNPNLSSVPCSTIINGPTMENMACLDPNLMDPHHQGNPEAPSLISTSAAHLNPLLQLPSPSHPELLSEKIDPSSNEVTGSDLSFPFPSSIQPNGPSGAHVIESSILDSKFPRVTEPPYLPDVAADPGSASLPTANNPIAPVDSIEFCSVLDQLVNTGTSPSLVTGSSLAEPPVIAPPNAATADIQPNNLTLQPVAPSDSLPISTLILNPPVAPEANPELPLTSLIDTSPSGLPTLDADPLTDSKGLDHVVESTNSALPGGSGSLDGINPLDQVSMVAKDPTIVNSLEAQPDQENLGSMLESEKKNDDAPRTEGSSHPSEIID